MPIFGRSRIRNSNNIVRTLPVLPYPLYKGGISWGDNFDQSISGEIKYDGVTEADIDAIIAAYGPTRKRTITLFGIPFVVNKFSYDRTAYPYGEDMAIETFTVSISLEGSIKNISVTQQTLAEKIGYISYIDGFAKSLGGSSGWAFSEFEVKKDGGTFGDGSNSISLDQDGHNQDPLTFGDQQQETPKGNRTIITPKEPVIFELTETSKDLDLPPENTKVLRDTTSNFDETGSKKVKRVSLIKDGKTQSEVIETWGFAYLQEDIKTADDELYLDDQEKIEDLWQLIELRITSWIYQKLGAVRLDVNINAPDQKYPSPVPTGDATATEPYTYGRLKFIIHPDYLDVATVGIDGGAVTLTTRAEFLVEKVTIGWKLGRYVKETDDRNSLDPEDTYYELFKFKRFPLVERTVNQLTASRGLIKGEQINPPFRVEFPDYASLEPRLKQYFDRRDATADGKVAILYPDPNYVEPLYVKAEITASNSFAWVNDPDSDPEDFDPEDPNSYQKDGRPKPPKRFMVGEESYTETERTLKLPKDLMNPTPGSSAKALEATPFYSERTTQFSSQDPGFDTSIEEISFKEYTGPPPQPDYQIQQYETKEATDGTLGSDAQGKKLYTITTPDNAAEFVKGASSVSFPNAKSISEAIAMLDIQLRKAKMQNNQSEISATWFYPEMRAGQPVSVGGDRFASLGIWRATSVQFQLDYTGQTAPDGSLLVTTPGTRITRGLDARRPIQIGEIYDPSPSNGGGDPTIDVEVSYRPSDIGTILEGVENRRNF